MGLNQGLLALVADTELHEDKTRLIGRRTMGATTRFFNFSFVIVA